MYLSTTTSIKKLLTKLTWKPAGLILLCLLISTFTLFPSTFAMAAEETDNTTVTSSAAFQVIDLTISPSETNVGRAVSITAKITNSGDATGAYTAELSVNKEIESSKILTINPGQTSTADFTYTPAKEGNYIISVGSESQILSVTLTDDTAIFREGPVVKLQPINDEITSAQTGKVELFFNNPSLNDITLQADVYIDVPSGIYLYSESFGLAAAAGTVYGQFIVPAGQTKTIEVNIKADETTVGETHFIHFTGMYWPEGNKDAYNPISLTYPIKVVEASVDPTQAPTTTNIDNTANGGGDEGPGGVAPYWWIILVAVVLLGIGVIIGIRRKTSVNIN